MLADALVENKLLIYLNVRDNNISDAGLSDMAAVLRVNRTLETVRPEMNML